MTQDAENITTIEMTSWDYQVCTEVWLGQDSDGVNDIFFPFEYNYTELYADCMQTYKVC